MIRYMRMSVVIPTGGTPLTLPEGQRIVDVLGQVDIDRYDVLVEITEEGPSA